MELIHLSGIVSSNQDPRPPFLFVSMDVFEALKSFVWNELLLGQGSPDHYAKRMDEHLIHLFHASVDMLNFTPFFLSLMFWFQIYHISLVALAIKERKASPKFDKKLYYNYRVSLNSREQMRSDMTTANELELFQGFWGKDGQ